MAENHEAVGREETLSPVSEVVEEDVSCVGVMYESYVEHEGAHVVSSHHDNVVVYEEQEIIPGIPLQCEIEDHEEGKEENPSPNSVTINQNSEQSGPELNNGDDQGSMKKSLTREKINEELKEQLWLAGPLIGVNLLQFCLQLISLMFVGHLGELALAGTSLGSSFVAATGFQVLLGLTCALDTLCGQSYGAKQCHMLGIYMQRAMLVAFLVCIPIAIIWTNITPILIALHQDPEIAEEAGLYTRFMIPGIFAFGLLQCLARFLQAQNIVLPMLLCTGVTATHHAFMCWLLVHKLPTLGIRGAAIANSISNWTNCLLLAFYVKFSSGCATTFTGLSKEAFNKVFNFLRLAVPSALMVCLEMWSFEVLVLLSGLLPKPKLETSVLSISLNTDTVFWMIPFGIGGAVSTRVSNELGAGHPQAARLAVRTAVLLTCAEGILAGSLLLSVRNFWGRAFSGEREVVKYITAMIPLIAVSTFLDGLQCVLTGTARGCGWQKIGAYINLGSFYLIGIPSSFLLAFVFHFGGKGLWLGIICALAVQVFTFSIITMRTQWEEEAQKETERVSPSTITMNT